MTYFWPLGRSRNGVLTLRSPRAVAFWLRKGMGYAW